MEDYEERASTRLGQPPAPRRSGRRWLLIVGLAFAFMLALGIGTLLGSTVSTTRAASITAGNANSAQTLAFPQGDFNSAQAPLRGFSQRHNDGQAGCLLRIVVEW